MAYRSWTHVALAASQLEQAEDFYARLFGFTVAFREAEAPDGWRTLPHGTSWAAARAAGVEPQLSQLRRDGVVLALEAASEQRDGGMLSHIGMAVDKPDLAELRQRAVELGCQVVTDRDELLVFDDGYSIRWEVGISTELRSNGVRNGRWFELPE